MLPSILHLHPCVLAIVLAVPMDVVVTAAAVAVEEDITNVVDLPRLLLEVGMVVQLIRIVHHLDILLRQIENILLRRDEMIRIHHVGEPIMFRKGGRVRDMMTVLRGDRLRRLEGKGKTMGGGIGELSIFCAGG